MLASIEARRVSVRPGGGGVKLKKKKKKSPESTLLANTRVEKNKTNKTQAGREGGGDCSSFRTVNGWVISSCHHNVHGISHDLFSLGNYTANRSRLIPVV